MSVRVLENRLVLLHKTEEVPQRATRQAEVLREAPRWRRQESEVCRRSVTRMQYADWARSEP